MIKKLNRRQMLASLGALGVGAVELARSPALARTRPRRDKLNLAVVGCGGQGEENLSKVSGENIVALCDVDQERAAGAFKSYPKARHFRDYRKMFDAMHGQIDAVVVSIPDHMHAPVSLAAMELGNMFTARSLSLGGSTKSGAWRSSPRKSGWRPRWARRVWRTIGREPASR